MNRHIASILAISAAAFVSGSALADDITIDTTPFSSSKSRAEVQAELGQFKKAGTSPWSTQYNPLAKFQGAASRDRVVAEFIASRQASCPALRDSGPLRGAAPGGQPREACGQPRNPSKRHAAPPLVPPVRAERDG